MKHKSHWKQIIKRKNGKYRTPSVKKTPSLEGSLSFVLECENFKVVYEGHQNRDCCQTILIDNNKVRGRNNNYVLWGDFREEYEQLSKQGFVACLLFYEEKEFTRFFSITIY